MLSFKYFTNKHYRSSLVESDSVNAAVFTFGRFNPPTKGHQLLIDKVKQVADQNNATPYIFTSQTHDAPKKDPTKIKNPLPYEQKIHFLQQAFPDANVVNDKNVRNIHDVIEYLHSRGYSQVYLVVGSDRVEEFKTRWAPYAEEYFQHVEIVSAGKRDPDAEGVAGMSGTKARQAAIEDDIAKFRATTGWSGDFVNRLFKQIRDQMIQEK